MHKVRILGDNHNFLLNHRLVRPFIPPCKYATGISLLLKKKRSLFLVIQQLKISQCLLHKIYFTKKYWTIYKMLMSTQYNGN